MNAEDYQKVKDIFQSVLEVSPEERAARLDRSCADDPALRREVERLLDSYESGYLEKPAVEDIAKEIAGDGLRTGQLIGHYTILEKIGSGGMGDVYLAEDSKLRRRVAIKFLSESLTNDPDRLHRFEQEAQTASALNHPNILTVFEIGETADTHYIVTEYIDGETLRARLNRSKLSVSEALDIAVQCASALSVAHENGIIHRDIKPENIMLRRDNLVKVLDFGLAKLVEKKNAPVSHDALTEKHLKTAPGVIMGTVQYMSPEQTRGHVTDTRTDIWSFGCVLYEMLAGKPPFSGDSSADQIAEIVKTHPAPLSKTADDVPERLDEIVGKTIEKDPGERYQNAKDLLIDLKRLKKKLDLKTEVERSHPAAQTETPAATRETVSNRNVPARETVSSPEYVVSGIKGHKWIATGVSILLLAAIGTSVYFAVTYLRISNSNDARFAYAANIRLAAKALDTADLDLAKQYLDETRPKDGAEDLRGFEWGYLSRLHADRAASQPLVLPHENHIARVAFSPDSKSLATVGLDMNARLWNLARGQQTAEFVGHNGWLISVAFSPDGKTLATGAFDEAARVWDIETGRVLFTIPSEKRVIGNLAFFAGGKMIAGFDGETIKFWNSATGAEQTGFFNTLEAHNPFAISPDGKLFAARLRSDDRVAVVWDFSSGRKLWTLRGHSGLITEIEFPQDSKTLLTGSTDKTARLWDAETGEELRKFSSHYDEVRSIAFSSDGNFAATGGKDVFVRIWDARNGSLIETLTGFQGDVRSIAFSPDGRKLAAGGDENSVRIWNVPKKEVRGLLRGHTATIRGISFSRDGKLLASASEDKTVKIWDVETEQDRHTLTGHTDSVHSAAFSPIGPRLATAGDDRMVMFWDTVTGKLQRSFDSLASGTVAAFSPDGKSIVTTHFFNGPEVRIWDAATVALRCSFLVGDEEDSALTAEFSKDSKQVTASMGDGSIRLWDAFSCVNTWTFSGGAPGAKYLPKFLPDGRLLAIEGFNDRSLRFIDTETGNQLALFVGDLSDVRAVAFAPDSRRLVTAGKESPVKVWDLTTGQELLSITADMGEISALAISKDGKTLAAGGSDGAIRIFRTNEID